MAIGQVLMLNSGNDIHQHDFNYAFVINFIWQTSDVIIVIIHHITRSSFTRSEHKMEQLLCN